MQQKKLNIKIDEKVGEGIYSNFFAMATSASEFIVDFGRMVPGIPDVKIYSRILMTPLHAKQLKNLLEKNIAGFEEKFGEIQVPGKQDDKSIGFKS